MGIPSVKIMADGGQGFLKICASIYPENFSPELDRALTEDELEMKEEFSALNSPAKKRSLYENGGMACQKGKLNGVHRLIMLAIVPKVKETYENMKVLFDLIQINGISFNFVSNFKLMLIVNGMQTATSTYPSPYCFVKLRNLRGQDCTPDQVEDILHILNEDSISEVSFWKYSFYIYFTF